MKFLLSLGRVLKFAGQSFWRNFWLSMATISVIVLTIITINFLFIINLITDQVSASVKEKIDISIYFDAKSTEDEVLEVKNFLLTLSEVDEINFVTKEEAKEIFRERHQKHPFILESLEELDENPLPPTLNVKAKDISQYDKILTVLNNSKYNDLIVDDNFNDHQFIIDQISNISNRVNRAGVSVSLIFIIISALIVFNAIRVAIYTHRREIQIMKLVGGSNTFIIAPFLLEGVFYALLGCMIGVLLTFPLLNVMQPFLSNSFTGTEISLVDEYRKQIVSIFTLQLFGLILLTFFGSSIAIQRYLRS